MPVLNIKDPEAHAMAKELARRTGKSLTAVVKEALQERLRREPRSAQEQERLKSYLTRISAEIRALPVLDDRTADEIIGYDEHGVPR